MPDYTKTVAAITCHSNLSDHAWFLKMTDLMPDTVFVTDADGSVVYLNRNGKDVFGASLPSPEMFFVPEERERIREILGGGDAQTTTWTILKKDGSTSPALFHVCRLFDDEMFTGVGGLIEDISYRQSLESALQKAEQKCRDIFRNTWEFWLLCDFDGNILESNVPESITYGDAYNFSEEELARLNIMDFLDEDLRPLMERNFREVMEKGQSKGIERVTFKDGTEKVYEHNQALVYENNKPVAIRLLSREVTEEFKAKKALEISEARYRSVFENTGLPTIILEPDLLISMVNVRFEELTGYTKGDIEGRLMLPGLIPDHTHRDDIIRFLKRSESSSIERECRIESRHGLIFDMIMQVGDVSETGQKVVSFTDITSRKKTENTLLESRARLQDENRLLRSSMKERYRFGNIVGKCRVMQELYEAIVNAAESHANVVLYGESGTGKELVAREIHQMSKRQKGRLVTVNCGAIPENIVESEFFGYKRGAFTGANSDKPGYLDSADGGILFLDEVGEIDLNLQVKLLRAIDTGWYTPLGSNAGKTADIRIISATNRNLMDLVKDGRIREDFFYRIHIIPIHLPPLRERKEDIPLLIEHFLNIHGDSGHSMKRIPMDRFLDYDWPGNIRELQNVVQRFLSMKKLDFDLSSKSSRTQDAVRPPDVEKGMGLAERVSAYEKEIIKDALATCKWQRGNAAKALGINRKTLFKKIVKHGLLDS